MKRLTRITVTVLILMLITAGTAFADDTAYYYDGAKAVSYAASNWIKNGDNNWTKDCTKFVRICAEAGGVPRDELKGNNGYTAYGYADYLLDNGYADKIKLTVKNNMVPYTANKGKISKGDLVLHVCTNPNCTRANPAFHFNLMEKAVKVDGYDETYWSRYQHAAGGKGAHGVLKLWSCPTCKAGTDKVALYCFHIKSKANGYTQYKGKVTGIKVTRAAYNKLTLSWPKLESATSGYNIFYNNHEVGFFRLAGHVRSWQQKFTYTVKDLDRIGQEVQFYIKPCRLNSKGGKAMDVGLKSAIIKAYTTPDLPSNVTGKRLSKTSVKITWTKGKGQYGCKLEYRYGGSKEWHWAGTSTGTSFTKTGLRSGKAVIFRLNPYAKGKGGIKYRNAFRYVTIK